MDQQTMIYVAFILGACLLLGVQYVVSRKKQLIPALAGMIQQMEEIR